MSDKQYPGTPVTSTPKQTDYPSVPQKINYGDKAVESGKGADD